MTNRSRLPSSFIVPYSAFLMLLAGCSGRADINFVSLNTSDIDPPAAKVFEFHSGPCYWWTDPSGELNIAMKHSRQNPLLGALGREELALSLVFDAMPAGSGKDYRVGPREVRAVFSSGVAGQRFNAFAGITAVLVRDDHSLRGSFRIWMSPQTELGVFSFLPQRPGNVLCFGTFEAVHDEQRGRAIRAESEAGGWVRGPRAVPTTRNSPGR